MTTPLATNAFTDILEGRRSIRKYDADVAIPRSEMLEMPTKRRRPHHR